MRKSPVAQFEREFVMPAPGNTLIVGSRVYGEKPDRRKLYQSAIGVDMQPGVGVDLVCDMEDTAPFGPFDHVECMSVLEHSRRPWLMAATIEQCMRPGATLFVTVPFVFRPHAYPDDYWRVSPTALAILFPHIEWLHVRYASNKLHPVDERKLPVLKHDEHPYIARTETCGFGVRR
jgi:hypothetical protein